jgi:ligand-binding SRPBCC domain-containing protein
MESMTLERTGRRIGRWLATAAVVALVVAGCSPKLEEGDVLEKNGDTFTIRLTKKIDEPIDKVWQGFQTPERLEKYSEQYQQTKLVKDEGNTKVVDYRVSTLGQIQAFTMELTMQPATKVVKFKTLESSLADITGEYDLVPTDGGKATSITYKATQKDKVNIPAPVSVQKTAIKEAFDNLTAGIDKAIKAGAMGGDKAS